MNLETTIKDIVNTLYPAATFALASDMNANQEKYDLNEIEYPFIFLDNHLFERITINQNANLLEKVYILITILKRDDYGEIYLQKDSNSNIILEETKLMAKRIMNNIYKQIEFRDINPEYELKPLIRIWNPTLTGVSVLANWNINNVVSWCSTD